MKLTGEYELTDHGVRIYGRFKDSHIADLRATLEAEGPNLIANQELGEPYFYQQAKKHIAYTRSLSSKFVTRCIGNGKIEASTVAGMMGLTKPINDYGYYYNLAGFGVEAGCPQIFAQRRMRWRDLNYKPHNTIIKVANVGWVFGETQSDGSFEVELYGLVNRHILTIVLGKATQYAKFLDDERILKLAQSKSNWVNNVRW